MSWSDFWAIFQPVPSLKAELPPSSYKDNIKNENSKLRISQRQTPRYFYVCLYEKLLRHVIGDPLSGQVLTFSYNAKPIGSIQNLARSLVMLPQGGQSTMGTAQLKWGWIREGSVETENPRA